MKKYIIKNCPAYDYDEEFNFHICKQPLVPYECSVEDCRKCTDCLLKRIVEKCKDMTSDKDFYAYDFAKEILQLLEIEEVE